MDAFNVTPAPASVRPGEVWHETGSHRVADGSCCHCGPGNHSTGPRFVCDHRPH